MMWCWLLFLVSSAIYASSDTDGSPKPCSVLTRCALEKCLDMDKMERTIKSTPRASLFGAVVEKFDVVCMAAKCRKECRGCRACHYALEQMNSLAQGEKTSGMCPKLETCVHGCLTTDLSKIISCVANKCNLYCYDGDCPSCHTISRKMFGTICKHMSMTSLPNVNYTGTCYELFSEMATEYVASARQRLAIN